MKIYTLTTVSNSFSMGYYSYLACIESWMDISDKVIVVDGHSDDGTIDELFRHIPNEKHHKLEIARNENTYWSKDYNFHLFQLSNGWHSILNNLDCDWLILVNADYVYNGVKKNLSDELLPLEEEIVVKFRRYKNSMSKVFYDERAFMLNIKKIKECRLPVFFGVREDTNIPSDFPIIAKEKSFFTDNGILKTIYRGTDIIRTKSLDLECGVYGHFFFNNNQCLYKCKRWSNAVSRYYGTALDDDEMLKYQNDIFESRMTFSKNEIKSWKHPKYILRIIDEYYREDMIGANMPIEKAMKKMLLKYYKIKKTILTKIMRVAGLPSLKKLHKWVPIDSKVCKPSFDLAEIYNKQNILYKKFQGRIFDN